MSALEKCPVCSGECKQDRLDGYTCMNPSCDYGYVAPAVHRAFVELAAKAAVYDRFVGGQHLYWFVDALAEERTKRGLT